MIGPFLGIGSWAENARVIEEEMDREDLTSVNPERVSEDRGRGRSGGGSSRDANI
jgi:hypothetical protein